ncbi:hypothetical protein HK13_04770 [Acetobacter indonesiensis]|nr:hypothetical protein HK13_04770 [Acetobacter indonesiensis]
MRRKRAPGEILEPFFIALVVTSGAVIEDSFVEETCSIKVAKCFWGCFAVEVSTQTTEKNFIRGI